MSNYLARNLQHKPTMKTNIFSNPFKSVLVLFLVTLFGFAFPKLAYAGRKDSKKCEAIFTMPAASDVYKVPSRIYQQDFEIPHYLIRLTQFAPLQLFTHEGFVRAHSSYWTLGANLDRFGHMVPLTHPEDYRSLISHARLMSNQVKQYYILLINPSKVTNLMNAKSEDYSKYGEYFGEVPSDAVISIIPLKEFMDRMAN
jgi:hypothetical protein